MSRFGPAFCDHGCLIVERCSSCEEEQKDGAVKELVEAALFFLDRHRQLLPVRATSANDTELCVCGDCVRFRAALSSVARFVKTRTGIR